jgi:CheY-like chemotaxis protein
VRAASHDLRQSVQTLALLNKSLTGSVDGNTRAALQEQSEAIESMARLLDALLNISKIESGVVRPVLADFSVAALFEKLGKEYAALAASKGLALELDARGAQTIRSDETLVGEILRNLLSNAVKFTAHGSISLKCSSTESAVCLEVRDTGIGIAAEELPKIFGEFYQVGVDAMVTRQGYGLGLGIVQRLATLLETEVKVESEVGKGSRFSFALPAGGPVRPSEGAVIASRAADRPGVESTLLLVEDDRSVRRSMELFLKARGYRVLAAATLEQALAMLGGDVKPDLLITDFHLAGGKKGDYVIGAVRERLGAAFPAILLSGDTSPGIARLPSDAHVRFATKPLDPNRLVELVEELLDAARARNPAL